MLNCGVQTPYDYVSSFIHFHSSDACYFLAQDSILCDSRTWSSLVNMPYASYPFDWFLQDISRPVSSTLDFSSAGLNFAEAMHWVHAPIVGIGFDVASQLARDGGKGHTSGQALIRAGIYAGEGQISSFAGVTLAGVDSIPGAITGPGDIIIIGGSYVVGSAATSFWLNQLNGAIISRWPAASDYIPYENPLPEDWKPSN
jgi:hypothetical protein